MNSSKGVQIGGKYPNISNFFEPVFELFMNSSKKVEQFMNSSKSESLLRIRAEHIFLRRQPQFFFLDFKNTVVKGTLTILGGKKSQSIIDTLTTSGTKKM